jgi:hypothetical protein
MVFSEMSRWLSSNCFCNKIRLLYAHFQIISFLHKKSAKSIKEVYLLLNWGSQKKVIKENNWHISNGLSFVFYANDI